MPSIESSSILPQEFGEECGVFGIVTPKNNSSQYTRLGLANLQHRGQAGSGIVSADGDRLHKVTGPGLVMQTFQDEFPFDMDLPGEISAGHTRYPTSQARKSPNLHLQPITDEKMRVAFAHNGNIADTSPLESFLDEKGIDHRGLNDSEMMHAGVTYFVAKGASLGEAVQKTAPYFKGSYSALFADKNMLVAIRDPKGIRPLSIGRKNGGYAVSSETCAFNSLEIEAIRDVMPGEMAIIGKNGIHSEQLERGEQRLDIFEYIYFARPDSEIFGQSVASVRKRLGANLANEMHSQHIQADMVIGVPNSGIPSAIGFSQESGVPYDEGIVKNLYVGRTFIEGATREEKVRLKLNPIRQILEGKDVIVVDDSIVRGTTSKALVEMLRRNGVRSLHLAIPCAEVIFPDFYGIDTPRQEELFSYKHKTAEEKRLALNVDSLNFLSYEGMIDAMRLPEEIFSTSAFSGDYPIDIGKRASEVDWARRTNGRF